MTTIDPVAQPRPTGRPPIFWISGILTYLQCPHRYAHRQLWRTPTNDGYSPALGRGIAAHTVLARTFDHDKMKVICVLKHHDFSTAQNLEVGEIRLSLMEAQNSPEWKRADGSMPSFP